MPDVPGSPIRRVAKAATSPVRGYINNHFEMVKEEVRQKRSEEWQRIADLEATVSEASLHQARVLARLRDEVEAVTRRLQDLEQATDRLADVVAAATVVADRESAT